MLFLVFFGGTFAVLMIVCLLPVRTCALSTPSDAGSSSVQCHHGSVVHTEDRAAGPEGADVESAEHSI